MQEKADKNRDVVKTVKEQMNMHNDVNGEYIQVRRDINGYPVSKIENGLDIRLHIHHPFINMNMDCVDLIKTHSPNMELEATIIKPVNCTDEEAILKLLNDDFIWLYEVCNHRFGPIPDMLCVNTNSIELIELFWAHTTPKFSGFSKTWYNWYNSLEPSNK